MQEENWPKNEAFSEKVKEIGIEIRILDFKNYERSKLETNYLPYFFANLPGNEPWLCWNFIFRFKSLGRHSKTGKN